MGTMSLSNLFCQLHVTLWFGNENAKHMVALPGGELGRPSIVKTYDLAADAGLWCVNFLQKEECIKEKAKSEKNLYNFCVPK